MILTDYFTSEPNRIWEFAVQCGVNYGVLRLPETEQFDITNPGHWRTILERFTAYNIKPVALEPIPNYLHDHIKTGDALRDASIDQLIKAFPIMARAGIKTICFNFMAYIGWLRTSAKIPERGGAKVTGFDLKEFEKQYAAYNETISEEELWENYRYFVKAVLPEAEKFEIKLALHPDDPPISPLKGISRIMTSTEAIKKAIHLIPSESLGITMCQATYQMMGEDLEQAIQEFAPKIYMIHFRNCHGCKTNFRETFHDNGEIAMVKIMRLYRDLGIDVPIRVDHVPLMAGEKNTIPGYTALGRLYAIGYLKGILEAL